MLSAAQLEQHRIRIKAADGSLLQAGFWWREKRPVAYFILSGLIFLFSLAGVTAGICLVYLLYELGTTSWSTLRQMPTNEAWMIVGYFVAIGIGLWAAVWANRVPWHYMFWRRTIVFSIDGKVFYDFYAIPFWLYDARKVPKVLSGGHDIADIASIELFKAPGYHQVLFYFTDGQKMAAATKLNETDGRVIVVQLSRALQDIREAMAAQEPPSDIEAAEA